MDKNVWSWFRRFVHFQAPERGTRGTEDVAEVTDEGEEQSGDGGRCDQSGEAGTLYGWLRCRYVFADNNEGGFGGIFGDWHGLRSEE